MRIDYARKVVVKHSIVYFEFNEIQNTIDNGHCLSVDEYHLEFLYVKDKIKPVIYFLSLKTDATRNELWLVTFHRITKKQFTKRLKPSQIVRIHSDEEFEDYMG